MNRKQERYSSRPRSLTAHYASSPSVLSTMLGQYGSYNYGSAYSPSAYRNYNPYSVGFGRTSSNLGIYGGTSSGYGGVYLGSLNLMASTKSFERFDKRLSESQKNFKPKIVPAAKVAEVAEVEEAPPVRPARRPRGALSKERSRSLNSLDTAGALTARSLSLTSLASDGYCSGSDRGDEDDPDYKALYEASASEVRRLRALLSTSEQQLREARATIATLNQLNQNSLPEIEKREKRAMERKLSEMEEELKHFQKLKAENERLRAENRALTRVVSKLTNSAAK